MKRGQPRLRGGYPSAKQQSRNAIAHFFSGFVCEGNRQDGLSGPSVVSAAARCSGFNSSRRVSMGPVDKAFCRTVMVAAGSKARKLAGERGRSAKRHIVGRKRMRGKKSVFQKENEPVTVATGSSNCDCSEDSLATGGWRLARRAGGNGHGEVLAVWGWLKFDGGLGTHTYLALHLRVSVKYKLHGVFRISIADFNSERLFVARDVGDFTRGRFGLFIALFWLRLLLRGARVQGNAGEH